MALVRVRNAPQPGAPKSAPYHSVGELVCLLVSRVLESTPKANPQSSGAAEEILNEMEFEEACYLVVRVTALNLTTVSLSPREQEIVRMAAEGHPNKIIADV